MKKIAFFPLILLFSSYHPLPAQVSLTYTGNMGVLLESENHSVLIDGLHEFYRPAYQNPPAPMVEDLLTVGGNYPIPEVALVTHYHRDHFSANLLNKLPGTVVMGPAQVTDSLTQSDQQTVRTIPYTEHITYPQLIEDLSIKAFRLDHVNRARHNKVQNIGYLVKMGGYTILHVGDTDWHQEMFENLDLPAAIDIAILPVWMVLQDQGPAWIQQYLNPQYLVVTHIDPLDAAETRREIHNKLPNSLVLTRLGEVHNF